MKSVLIVLIIAMMPVVELRGAIPVGVATGLPLATVLLWAIVGNCIVIVPLLHLFGTFLHYLLKMPVFGSIMQKWFDRVEKKTEIIDKYGFWGLCLFVAVPLPGSGVWSGTLAASLLEMKKRKATLACVCGVFLSAVVVTLATLGIINLF